MENREDEDIDDWRPTLADCLELLRDSSLKDNLLGLDYLIRLMENTTVAATPELLEPLLHLRQKLFNDHAGDWRNSELYDDDEYYSGLRYVAVAIREMAYDLPILDWIDTGLRDPARKDGMYDLLYYYYIESESLRARETPWRSVLEDEAPWEAFLEDGAGETGAVRRPDTKAATPGILAALGRGILNSDGGAVIAAIAIGSEAATPEIIAGLAIRLDEILVDESVSAGRDRERLRYIAAAIAVFSGSAGTTEILGALGRAIRAQNPVVRADIRPALKALDKAGGLSQEFLADLAADLDDEREHVREGIAEALEAIGRSAATPAVLKQLIKLMGADDPKMRVFAVVTIGRLGAFAATPEVFAALVAGLRDGDADVRWRTAYAIMSMGKAAAVSDVVGALNSAKEDDDNDVRAYALQALHQIGKNDGSSRN